MLSINSKALGKDNPDAVCLGSDLFTTLQGSAGLQAGTAITSSALHTSPLLMQPDAAAALGRPHHPALVPFLALTPASPGLWVGSHLSWSQV